MRKVSTLVGLTLFALAGSARAQEAAAPAGDTATPPADTAAAPAPAPEAAPAAAAGGTKITIGADGAFHLPLGTLADGSGMGVGALVRGEYSVIPNLNVTLRTGYIFGLSKDIAGAKASISWIPIWVGGKYFINDMIFAGLELGMNMLKSKVEIGGASLTGSDNKIGANVGAGVLLSGLELRAQLEILDTGHSGDTMGLMLNVGYNFAKL